jgi:transmembrane sensor
MKDDTQLARWLAGEMSDNELEAFEKSPDFHAYVRIRNNFSQIQKPQFDADSILNKVLQHEKTTVKTIPLYRKTWLQVAAVLVVLLGLAFGFTRPEHPEADNGEHFAFMLPDHSEVILNSGSDATYRDWNWDSNRRLSLNGEAYFKVAKGKTFSVSTNLGTVQVVGTQFNVKARDNRLDVVCYEGRVLVKFKAEEVLLTPGQSISFGGNDPKGKTDVKVAAPEWLQGELVFSRDNLTAIVAEVERHYDVKIAISGGSAQVFTGALPGNDLDAVLKVLSLTFHLKYVKTAETISLSPVDANQ